MKELILVYTKSGEPSTEEAIEAFVRQAEDGYAQEQRSTARRGRSPPFPEATTRALNLFVSAQLQAHRRGDGSGGRMDRSQGFGYRKDFRHLSRRAWRARLPRGGTCHAQTWRQI